jgi:ADP-ribose pyrophosphatase YjhB (NUDIX family)
MMDPRTVPAALTEENVGYLPLPNRVDLVLTDVLPPVELTPTSFVIGIADDGGVVLANHSRRGPEITGGHVDPGETPEQTARREGLEESGAEYGTLWPIGYLRCVSQGSVPDDHPYPHPVGYQALYAGAVLSMEPRDDYLECGRPVTVDAEGIGLLARPLARRLALLHAAALAAVGRDRSLEDLAKEARPLDGDDRGSPRQVAAESRLLDECRRRRPDVFRDGALLSEGRSGTTAEERVDEALRLLGAKA